MVRWPKVPVKPDPDAKDWRFNPHHGRGENDIRHCQKIGLVPHVTLNGVARAFPVPRPTGFRHI